MNNQKNIKIEASSGDEDEPPKLRNLVVNVEKLSAEKIKELLNEVIPAQTSRSEPKENRNINKLLDYVEKLSEDFNAKLDKVRFIINQMKRKLVPIQIEKGYEEGETTGQTMTKKIKLDPATCDPPEEGSNSDTTETYSRSSIEDEVGSILDAVDNLLDE